MMFLQPIFFKEFSNVKKKTIIKMANVQIPTGIQHSTLAIVAVASMNNAMHSSNRAVVVKIQDCTNTFRYAFQYSNGLSEFDKTDDCDGLKCCNSTSMLH